MLYRTKEYGYGLYVGLCEDGTRIAFDRLSNGTFALCNIPEIDELELLPLTNIEVVLLNEILHS